MKCWPACLPKPKRPNKFRAESVIDPGTGQRFDSRREYRRWCHLYSLWQAGLIEQLQTQRTFQLRVNGVLVATYTADFVYIEDGELVVEDCKGVRTELYKLKRDLMWAIHRIRIRET